MAAKDKKILANSSKFFPDNEFRRAYGGRPTGLSRVRLRGLVRESPAAALGGAGGEFESVALLALVTGTGFISNLKPVFALKPKNPNGSATEISMGSAHLFKLKQPMDGTK